MTESREGKITVWVLDIFAGQAKKREARTLRDQAIADHGPKARRFLEHRIGDSDRKQIYRIAIRMLRDAPTL